jgi:acyl-CoA dehydrogenase
MSLFLCPLDAEGVTIHPIKKMGRNAIASCSVFFDDVFVSEDDLIGAEGRGFHNLLDGRNPERILVAAQAIGVGRVARRRAVDYANSRIVFGRPIGKNQGIQFPLADALARLDVSELAMMKAAWLYDKGLPCGRESTIAKYLGAEAGWLAADRKGDSDTRMRCTSSGISGKYACSASDR